MRGSPAALTPVFVVALAACGADHREPGSPSSRGATSAPSAPWSAGASASTGDAAASSLARAAADAGRATRGDYVGSQACAPCHGAIYDRWKRTRMANVVRDPAHAPRRHPARPRPPRSARHLHARRHRLRLRQQVEAAVLHARRRRLLSPARAMGRHAPHVAKVLRRRRHRLVGAVLSGRQPAAPDRPALRRVPLGQLRRRNARRDASGTSAARSATAQAASTRGSPPDRTSSNPARLDAFHEDDVCVQCHSQGRPRAGMIQGRAYDWPVGFRVGLELKDYWQLDEPHPGTQTFTHFADGTAHKNRMQGNDFTTSLMYARGVTCASCHDVHGTANDADLVAPAGELCLRCHSPGGRNGPRAPTNRAPHPPRGRLAWAAHASRATCRRSSRRWGTSTSGRTPSSSSRRRPPRRSASPTRAIRPGATRTGAPRGPRRRCERGQTYRRGGSHLARGW